MEYKVMEIGDVDMLVALRLEVLRAANGLAADAPLPGVEENTRRYYEWALPAGMHTALVAKSGAVVAGCGGVSYYNVMPTRDNPAGLKAYIMNMYTREEFRRQGVARHLLQLLVQDAQRRGAGQILLEATDMGRPLYEGFGFVDMRQEMTLPAGWQND